MPRGANACLRTASIIVVPVPRERCPGWTGHVHNLDARRSEAPLDVAGRQRRRHLFAPPVPGSGQGGKDETDHAAVVALRQDETKPVSRGCVPLEPLEEVIRGGRRLLVRRLGEGRGVDAAELVEDGRFGNPRAAPDLHAGKRKRRGREWAAFRGTRRSWRLTGAGYRHRPRGGRLRPGGTRDGRQRRRSEPSRASIR